MRTADQSAGHFTQAAETKIRWRLNYFIILTLQVCDFSVVFFILGLLIDSSRFRIGFRNDRFHSDFSYRWSRLHSGSWRILNWRQWRFYIEDKPKSHSDSFCVAVFSGGGAGVEVLIGSLKLNSLLVSMLWN